MTTWDLEWYDQFCGDVYERLNAAVWLSNALDALGFPDDDDTIQLALGEG